MEAWLREVSYHNTLPGFGPRRLLVSFQSRKLHTAVASSQQDRKDGTSSLTRKGEGPRVLSRIAQPCQCGCVSERRGRVQKPQRQPKAGTYPKMHGMGRREIQRCKVGPVEPVPEAQRSNTENYRGLSTKASSFHSTVPCNLGRDTSRARQGIR